MVFITNNTAWSPRSVCDLYRRRWDIEVFFKQVKQSLKLGSFLGHSANAVRWQVYTALLVYVLLRFMAHLSAWGHRLPLTGLRREAARLVRPLPRHSGHAALRGDALGVVGTDRPFGPAEILWDSIATPYQR